VNRHGRSILAPAPLVCVGRLAPQKGQLLLVNAFADAVERGMDAKLVLVGDGELRPELEALILRRGMLAHVRIKGWLAGPEVRRELLASRALVLPSFAEGLPMVIMEAFALGRPVLSTYITGIPELVRAEDNGWLVPAGSRAATTEALLAIMHAPISELERMAQRGRDAVRQNHYTPTEAAKLAAHIWQSVQATGARSEAPALVRKPFRRPLGLPREPHPLGSRPDCRDDFGGRAGPGRLRPRPPGAEAPLAPEEQGQVFALAVVTLPARSGPPQPKSQGVRCGSRRPERLSCRSGQRCRRCYRRCAAAEPCKRIRRRADTAIGSLVGRLLVVGSQNET